MAAIWLRKWAVTFALAVMWLLPLPSRCQSGPASKEPIGSFHPDSLTISSCQKATIAVPSVRDPWLSRDKGAHFAACAFLASVAYYVARREQDWRDAPSANLAAGVAMAAGIAKEAWDGLSGRGTPSWKDLLFDALGSAVAVALVRVPDGTIFEGER